MTAGIISCGITIRPETILADTAVAVHPHDPRYMQFIGRKVIVPILGREVPVIADEYVDREFGTGPKGPRPGMIRMIMPSVKGLICQFCRCWMKAPM